MVHLQELQLFHESGYITGELFLQWLEHFVSSVKPYVEENVLVLLDGHLSRKNFHALEYAKQHGVAIYLPPHCTHRLQPLDVSFFGPLNTFYNREVTKWLKNHPGRTVTIPNFKDISVQHTRRLPLFRMPYLDLIHVESIHLIWIYFQITCACQVQPLTKNLGPKQIASVGADENMARNDESPHSNNESIKLIIE
jgi:hypothetical protein